MNQENVSQKVLNELIKIAPEVKEILIKKNEDLREQVDLDSIDYLRFISNLCMAFKIKIPESDYEKIKTLEKLEAYIKSLET